MLDLIVEPEWGLRYFSYQPSWGPGEDLASMRDGSGNEYWIVFAADGAAYAQGFDHESEFSPWGNDDGALHEGIIAGNGTVPPHALTGWASLVPSSCGRPTPR
jgi:hypothetical protein